MVRHITAALCLLAPDTSRKPTSKQDGSLELASRYGCTQPSFEQENYDDEEDLDTCGVEYVIAQSYLTPSTIAAVKIGDLLLFHVDLCKPVRGGIPATITEPYDELLLGRWPKPGSTKLTGKIHHRAHL